MTTARAQHLGEVVGAGLQLGPLTVSQRATTVESQPFGLSEVSSDNVLVEGCLFQGFPHFLIEILLDDESLAVGR